MTWTRDNGILAADNPLCAGALTDLVRGNGLHVMEQGKHDITVPIVGTSLGGGVLISGAGAWCAAFKQIRPFPVPVRFNSDGTYRQIKVTLDCYWSGDFSSKVRLRATSHWVDPDITDHSNLWNAAGSSEGLLGSRFENYGDTDLPSDGAGEKTLTLTVTPDAQTVNTYAPHKDDGGTGFDIVRTALVTWLVFDAFLLNTSTIRFRVIRVQDVVA
jgi:hypothetical protein